MCLMCLMNPVSYAKKTNQEQMEMHNQKLELLNALGVGEVSRVPRPQSSPPRGVGNRRRIARTGARIQELQRALVRREALVREKQWCEGAVRVRGGMIRVMPGGGKGQVKVKVKAEAKARPSLPTIWEDGPPRGKAKGKEKALQNARPSLASSSKAAPPRGVIIRKPNSKGSPAPWKKKKAAVKVIFV